MDFYISNLDPNCYDEYEAATPQDRKMYRDFRKWKPGLGVFLYFNRKSIDEVRTLVEKKLLPVFKNTAPFKVYYDGVATTDENFSEALFLLSNEKDIEQLKLLSRLIF